MNILLFLCVPHCLLITKVGIRTTAVPSTPYIFTFNTPHNPKTVSKSQLKKVRHRENVELVSDKKPAVDQVVLLIWIVESICFKITYSKGHCFLPNTDGP